MGRDSEKTLSKAKSRFLRPTKQDIQEMEESTAGLNVDMGRNLSMGIPWDEFSEIEIQAILKIHFEVLGYNVIWRHKDDPANEGGIDLECEKRTELTKVIVAVKKKPRKEALAQVLELSSVAANQRVFVYIGGASQSFRDKLLGFKPKVEFWNEERLEEELNESGLTLSLKVDNSPAKKAMFEIMKRLLQAIKTQPPSKHVSSQSPGLMDTLWGMKDRAVTLSKCAGMAQLLFEDSSRFGELSHSQVQNLLVWCLDYLYAYGLLSLRNTFDALSGELSATLYSVYQETRVRSNWLELFSYERGLAPGGVEMALKDYEKDRAKWKELAVKLKMNKRGTVSKHGGLDEAANELRILGIWADGLESTIDDIYRHVTPLGLPANQQ